MVMEHMLENGEPIPEALVLYDGPLSSVLL